MLVAVGLGALTPTQVKAILESRDPLGQHQRRVAPAQGLFLKSVFYRELGKTKWPGKAPAQTPVTDHPLTDGSSLDKGLWWQCQ